VIADLKSHSQRLLQAHRSAITCCAATADKTLVATGEAGAGAVLVVWEAATGEAVRAIEGVRARARARSGRASLAAAARGGRRRRSD
jgi:hypothetical protein